MHMRLFGAKGGKGFIHCSDVANFSCQYIADFYSSSSLSGLSDMVEGRENMTPCSLPKCDNVL